MSIIDEKNDKSISDSILDSILKNVVESGPEAETEAVPEEKPEKASKKSGKRDRIKKIKLHDKYNIPEDYNEKDDFLKIRLMSIVFKKRMPLIIIMAVIFAAFISIVGYVNSLKVSQTVMMLNYEQSVDGLAPNGTRFNLSDFKSEEVIEQIIKNASLEGKVTSDELRESISISALAMKKPTAKANYYIPTSFRIVYTKSKNVKGIKADNMLDVICNTYFQYFYDNYTMNAQVLNDDDYSELGDMEYSQIASYIKMRISAIADFLNMRIDEAGSFKSQETGETFYSVRKMVENLKNYDLENYSAYIWEKGIVHDKGVFINTREYLIDKNTRDKKYNINEYYIRKDVIEYYNDIMSTSILIPTVNDQKHYYMARTKTGVDYLATAAESYLAKSKELEKDIMLDKDRVSKCEKETIIKNHEKADKMAKGMIKELTRIEKLANQVNKEYKAEYVKSYITFTKATPSLLDRIPKRKVVLLSFLFVLFAFYVYYKECSYIARRGRRK